MQKYVKKEPDDDGELSEIQENEEDKNVKRKAVNRECDELHSPKKKLKTDSEEYSDGDKFKKRIKREVKRECGTLLPPKNENNESSDEEKEEIRKTVKRKAVKRELDKGPSKNEVANGQGNTTKRKKYECKEDDSELGQDSVKVKEGKESKQCFKSDSSDKLVSQTNNDFKHRKAALLSEISNIPMYIALNISKLFDDEATIPFIIRYRKHMIGNINSDQLRNIKDNYETAKKIIEKGEQLKVKLKGQGYLTNRLQEAIDSAQSLGDLEYLYEPFKVTKSSKLVKTINLGLVPIGENLLWGRGMVHLESLINKNVEGLKTLNEIKDLMIFYIGNTISKDAEQLKRVNEWKREQITLQCKKVEKDEKKDTEKRNKKLEDFANYYNFSQLHSRIRPHQILAINRGEAQEYIKVSLDIPENFKMKLYNFAKNRWLVRGMQYPLRTKMFDDALNYMYSKRVVPFIKRTIRSELTKLAEKEALEVFSKNLKYLLLAPPIRGVTVLAIDPGFINGCKIAVLNPQQEVLETGFLYLNKTKDFVGKYCELVNLVTKHSVNLIAIGNGKGCREVEFKISLLINDKCFHQDISYVIANESGVSTYSCTQEAASEYPQLPPNIISAISLGKRVQDPICEYVKVEPKHLGVGMYQHDLNDKKLEAVLDEVVTDCVSNVGVDINTAPLIILKKLAGLTEKKAKTLLERREKKGPFFCRKELMDIKGIGPKTFQQCSGFIKILPGTLPQKSEKTSKKIDLFDQTIIHPEDYGHAERLLKLALLKKEELGSANFIETMKKFIQSNDMNKVAHDLNMPFETLQLMVEALTVPADYDLRAKFHKPIFKKGLKTIQDLKINEVVTGQVNNVTPFGAFVDIGVENSGLIPSRYSYGKELHTGQRVQVRISNIDNARQKITLILESIESAELF